MIKPGKGCRQLQAPSRRMEGSKNVGLQTEARVSEQTPKLKKLPGFGKKQQVVLPKMEGGLLLSGLNQGVCGRLEVTESADEDLDGGSVNRIQGQEPRRWWEAIKGSDDWRRTSSGGRERRG